MSGVATLKVRGAKRHFDEMAVDLPLPSQACSPSRRLPPLKRGRCNPPTPRSTVKPSSSSTLCQTPQSYPQSIQIAQNPSSSHQPIITENNDIVNTPKLSQQQLAALAKHCPKRLKRVVERVANGEASLIDKLFSVNDLREIITSVLAQREAELTADFTNTLHDRLAEQFRDFTKFNEDYVSRTLRGRDSAYLS